MSKKLLIIASGLIFAASAAVPAVASASALTPAQVNAIISLLQTFGADQSVIANVSAALGGTTPVSASCVTLTAQMTLGSTDAQTGGQVSQLQNYLIAKGYLTGTSATGYYGFLTSAAVGKLQLSLGLVSSQNDTAYGIMGPKTRAAIACGTTLPPSIIFSASPTSGAAPLTVTFHFGSGANYQIDFGDGQTQTNLPNACAGGPDCLFVFHTYASAGTYTAQLKDASGAVLRAVTVTVTSGTTGPSSPTASMQGIVSLNGVNQYAPIPALPDSGAFTVSAWVLYTGNTCGTILSDADHVAQNDLVLGMDASNLYIRADKNGAGTNSSVPISAFGAAGCEASYKLATGRNLAGSWHHLAWVNDGSSSSLYIDGSLAQTLAVSGSNIGNHASAAQVGRMFDGATGSYPGGISYFPGHIADLRYYNSALTVDQISQLYAAGDQYSNVTITPTMASTRGYGLPDLTASAVSVTGSGTTRAFATTILNIGTGTTVNTENNPVPSEIGTTIYVLFQRSSGSSGSNTTDMFSMIGYGQYGDELAPGGTHVVNSAQYSFPAPGTYYVRACADMRSSTDVGTIAESHENNNCGPWSDPIVIVGPPEPTAAIDSSSLVTTNTKPTITGTASNTSTVEVGLMNATATTWVQGVGAVPVTNGKWSWVATSGSTNASLMPGTYTVIVENSAAPYDTLARGILTVNGAATLTTSPTSGTAPLAVTLHYSVPVPSASYSIDFGDGQSQSPVPTACSGGANCLFVTHTYASAGTYTARLKDSSGAALRAATVTVN